MMNKLFRLIFKEYEEDNVSLYVHSGVGYSGIDFDLWYAQPARLKHCGVGFGGTYD
jgi:hypothetical protein